MPEEKEKSVDGTRQRSNRNLEALGGTAARIAVSGAAGGLGRAADRAVQQATAETRNRLAKRAAEKYRKRREKKGKQVPQNDDKKLTGVGFYIMITLTAIKDISDVLLDISVILSFFVVLTGLIVSFAVVFYLFYNNVKPTTRKVVTWAISVGIEMVPFLSILPGATINLILIRIFENSDLLRKVTENKMVASVSGGKPGRSLPQRSAA